MRFSNWAAASVSVYWQVLDEFSGTDLLLRQAHAAHDFRMYLFKHEELDCAYLPQRPRWLSSLLRVDFVFNCSTGLIVASQHFNRGAQCSQTRQGAFVVSIPSLAG